MNFSKKTLLLLLGLLAIMTLSLTSCEIPQEDEEDQPKITKLTDLVGSWNGPYPGEVYTISKSNDVLTFDGGFYTGEIVNTNTFALENDGEDVIIIKLTTPGLDQNAGKYYGISVKEYGTSTLKISGAYKTSGVTQTDTQEEAEAEFTVKNGYFVFYSGCEKQ